MHIQTRASTPDGAHRGTQSQEAFVTIRPGTLGESGRYEALSHIDLPPGRYALRIAAHSSLTETAGSVFAEVDVPDFAKAPISLSGVFVTIRPTVQASRRRDHAPRRPLHPEIAALSKPRSPVR